MFETLQRMNAGVDDIPVFPRGFDHGAGHPLLFLDDAKALNGQNSNYFKDLDHYIFNTSLSTF